MAVYYVKEGGYMTDICPLTDNGRHTQSLSTHWAGVAYDMALARGLLGTLIYGTDISTPV